MEIVPLRVPLGGDSHQMGLPFNRRNVEEWSRLDSITGMMEKAKIETDRWSASNSVGAHNFAKMVDSRERNNADGSLQQRQRKQFEIFQTSVPGGSMQVIRTQTVTSSSSSSQWSSSTKAAFGELQLPVNRLDLSSQKTKGSVGRSGSISTRRPPTRPRILAGTTTDSFSDVAAHCQRLHEEAKARIFGTSLNGFDSDNDEPGGVVITELDSPSDSTPQKTNLNRQKSCSNENVNEESEESSSIRRSSRFRRSLQIPKTTIADDIPDWTNGKSLKERAAEIENLLRRGSSTTYEVKKDVEKQEKVPSPVKVKSSFVSAETLKEVRDRLRKSSAEEDVDPTEAVNVKDFVSGMEAKFATSKPIVNGTSSIDYRTTRANNHTSEWYRRRKSYGFEKVEDTSSYNGHQSNGDSSTDSGYGQNNDSKVSSPFRRFGEESSLESAWTRKSPLPTRERSSLRLNKNPWISQLRGTKLVDRQWFSGTPDPETNDSGVPDSPKNEDKIFDFDGSQKKKKVEFCKTEVHFAAEPGRFQIIETDGKPPASAVLRRTRRRNSGRDSPIENYLGLPEFKFGDSPLQKNHSTPSSEKFDSLSRKIESELEELSKIVVEIPKKEEPISQVQQLPKLYDVQEEDSMRPRSILKNFRKTYLLGENPDSAPVWKSTVVLQNKRYDDLSNNKEDRKSYSSDGESELQIRFRNLKNIRSDTKTEPVTVEIKRRSLPDDVLLKGGLRTTTTIGIQKPSDEDSPVLSVAERIEELNAKTYSSKIDFRSGEMTVLQNGTWREEEKKKEFASENFRKDVQDVKFTSNQMVKRFPTVQTSNNNTTTRISINIPCESNGRLCNKKPSRSQSFGGGQLEKPQSAALVMMSSKPVHEIIHKFDSLARPVRKKDKRRQTMPINYKAPKEYTHADLEEELRNFTEDLDKDFRDIYEEEIGSLKGSCRDLKNMFEKVCKENVSCDKAKTLPLTNGLKKMISKESSRHSQPPPTTYDSDDSDLLADEEVRSYMSTGQGGSDSDDLEEKLGNRKKSFERIRTQFKKLELRNDSRKKETKQHTTTAPVKPTFVDASKVKIAAEPYYAAPPKVASIALRYEDDPTFNISARLKDITDRWEKTSNSSTLSDTRSRERASYLNGISLSEKYSRRSSNSSLDNLFDGNALQRVKDVQESIRNSLRSSRFREVKKETKSSDTKYAFDELTRATKDILMTANGFTDESLTLTSDDDDVGRKVIKKGNITTLTTISEGRKTLQEKSETHQTREKTLSSRTTRLLQRASDREAAMAQRSSSEDIPSNVEPIKKKLVRKPRPTVAKSEKEKVPEKTCSRVRLRPKEKESNSIPRERVKTVSSAAKEVSRVSSKTNYVPPERPERTKPSHRRELLAKADAAAEQAARTKRPSHSTSLSRTDPNQESLTKRRSKVSLRRVEAARVSQPA